MQAKKELYFILKTTRNIEKHLMNIFYFAFLGENGETNQKMYTIDSLNKNIVQMSITV